MDDQNEIQITLSKRKMNNQQEEDENRDQNKKLTKSQRKYLDRLEKIANGLSLSNFLQTNMFLYRVHNLIL